MSCFAQITVHVLFLQILIVFSFAQKRLLIVFSFAQKRAFLSPDGEFQRQLAERGQGAGTARHNRFGQRARVLLRARSRRVGE